MIVITEQRLFLIPSPISSEKRAGGGNDGRATSVKTRAMVNWGGIISTLHTLQEKFFQPFLKFNESAVAVVVQRDKLRGNFF